MPEHEAITAMRLPKDLFEVARLAAARKNISLSEFMRSALIQAVKAAPKRRRTPGRSRGQAPETMEGGVGPP